MIEKLRALLKKTFVDIDIKKEALNVQETNIRHAVAANTVFDHPSKWLLEEELEDQCIDWVYQFLLSKEFPERWAAKLSSMTKIRVFSDAAQLDKLKACQGGANKGIATDQLESYLADVLQNLGRELYSNDFWSEETDVCRLVKDISVHAIKNTRRKMEDKHVVLRHYSDMFLLPTGYSFFGVFDGHGGVDAARFTSTHLSGILSKYLKENCPCETAPPNNSFKQTPKTSKQSLNKTLQTKQSPNKTPQAKPSQNARSTSLLVPQLSKECRKSFESLKDTHLLAEPKLTKIQRNSYHESDSRKKNPLPKEPSPLIGCGDGGQGVRRALEKSFLETNRIFCERAKIDNNNSGCTAVCLLMEEDKKKFHVAWVGDSQALLVRDGKPVEIMLPHKPEREDERARIIALGGSVVHIGAWRVNGAISVSRAIGDIGHKPYITSQPDIESYDIQSGDDYLVLACDGLWDVLAYDDVISHVANHMMVEKERKSVAQSLVRAAKDKGSSDNITVMVIFLRDDSPLVSTSQPANRESKISNESPKSGEDKSGKRGSGNPAGDAPQKDGNSNAVKPDKSSGEFSKLSLKTRSLSEEDDILNGEKRERSMANLEQDKTETQFNLTKDDQRNKITWEWQEWSPKTESEEVGISDSTNNDSKENYLTSSSELPLEFSPLRSEVKGETEGNSTSSIKSRAKRSPKISSSTEDKEDKENVDLRLKMCLKTDVSPSSSNANHRVTDTASQGQKLLKDSKPQPSPKRELKETNVEVKKGTLLAQTPDSTDNIQHFRVPPFSKQKHPTNLHVPKGNISQYPPKQPFTSISSVSVGFLKDTYRKFSQTSGHIKKLDLTPTSCRPASNFGSCSFAEHSQAKGWPCQKERWAVAIETGEDLEGMFECREWEGTGFNVSSSRW